MFLWKRRHCTRVFDSLVKLEVKFNGLTQSVTYVQDVTKDKRKYCVVTLQLNTTKRLNCFACRIK